MHGSHNQQQTGLILLAAGGSQRLGQPKQLLKYEGEGLLRRAARMAIASACHPILVVLGAQAEKMRAEIDDLALATVVNENWATGMGSSIRVGMHSMVQQGGVNAVVIMLCDQPHVGTDTLNELVAAYQATNAPIVAAQYNHTLGVPALFSFSIYPELLALKGPQGAKNIILNYREQVKTVLVPEAMVDIDTLAEYDALIRKMPNQSGH